MTISDSVGSAAGIPTIWHPALLRQMRTPLVFLGLTTREYEGDITQAGDTVRIVTTTAVTRAAYVRGTPITAERLVLAGQELVIDKQYGFNFEVNDLDMRQVKPNFVEEQSSVATYTLRKGRDSDIALAMQAGAGTDLGDFSVGTGAGDADAFEILARMATELDENDTPDNGAMPSMDAEGGPDGGFRFVVVPPFFAEMLVIDPRKSSFGTTDNLKTYGERYIGRSAAGLEIFKSNQLPAGIANSSTHTDIIGGWSRATAFAGQLTQFETQRVQGDFADFHLGLDVYGTKVIRAAQIVRAEVVRA
jgi:hypothetical protein